VGNGLLGPFVQVGEPNRKSVEHNCHGHDHIIAGSETGQPRASVRLR
jgi:hypothetical protein